MTLSATLRSKLSLLPAMPHRKRRVLVVDDHPLFRKGVSASINADGDFEVCGEASNSREALSLLRTTSPEAVLLDIGLPGANGIELMKMLKAEQPDLLVIMLSMHSDAHYAIRALKAGARGYLVKGEPAASVIQGLRDIFSGSLAISQGMYERLIFRAIQTLDMGKTAPVDRLTRRELEVFELVGDGLDKREIAERLGLSPKTVDTHRNSAREKLCCGDLEELAKFAADWREYQREQPEEAGETKEAALQE